MSGLACGDKLKAVLVWNRLSIHLGWEKTIWRNLERIVIFRQFDEEQCLGTESECNRGRAR